MEITDDQIKEIASKFLEWDEGGIELLVDFARAVIAAHAAEPVFQCADCKAPLRAGYTCDACGSDAAEYPEA